MIGMHTHTHTCACARFNEFNFPSPPTLVSILCTNQAELPIIANRSILIVSRKLLKFTSLWTNQLTKTEKNTSFGTFRTVNYFKFQMLLLWYCHFVWTLTHVWIDDSIHLDCYGLSTITPNDKTNKFQCTQL